MITVKDLIAALARFPQGAMCYAYEGEISGVVVVEPEPKRDELGYVFCSEGTSRDSRFGRREGDVVIYEAEK